MSFLQYNMELKLYNTLPEEAKEIRIQVFVKEQGFKNEFDEIDSISKHIVCFNENKPIATARFFTQDNGKTYHIGRISVLKEYRKKHIGKQIIEFAQTQISKIGGNKIELSSQIRAKGFYKKCGFIETGDEYLDEFCPHIRMTKSL